MIFCCLKKSTLQLCADFPWALLLFVVVVVVVVVAVVLDYQQLAVTAVKRKLEEFKSITAH
jgi:hypothetical protein